MKSSSLRLGAWLWLAFASAAGCSDDGEGDLLGIANAPTSGGSAGSGTGGSTNAGSGGANDSGGMPAAGVGGDDDGNPTEGGSTSNPVAGAAGATSEAGSGQAGGPSAGFCGDTHVDEGEGCDDGNTLDGDGCGSDCRSVCEECEAQHCVDLEGSNYLEFVYENTELAVDGPAAGLMKSELSRKLVGCLRKTGCFLKSYDLMGCYCGAASSNECLAGNANGECREAIEWAVEATDAATIVGLLEDVSLSSGQVAALMKDCDLRQCGDVCLPVDCDNAVHWSPRHVYQANEVAVATCLNGACDLGKLQRFSCVAASVDACSLLQPGTSGWEAAWAKQAACP